MPSEELFRLATFEGDEAGPSLLEEADAASLARLSLAEAAEDDSPAIDKSGCQGDRSGRKGRIDLSHSRLLAQAAAPCDDELIQLLPIKA